MVTGDNKGHTYEKKITEILKKKKIPLPSEDPAGSADGSDLTFLYKKQEIPFEMKNNVKDPDYGQCVVIPKQVGKKWIWDWSPGSKKNKPEVIEFYNNLECIDGSVGVLEYIKNKNFTPNKRRVDDSKLTEKLKNQDQKTLKILKIKSQ